MLCPFEVLIKSDVTAVTLQIKGLWYMSLSQMSNTIYVFILISQDQQNSARPQDYIQCRSLGSRTLGYIYNFFPRGFQDSNVCLADLLVKSGAHSFIFKTT